MTTNNPILPGSTIGILGGGQLGCMLAVAARTLGYKVAALDPNPQAPIKALSDHFVCASFFDADAAEHLAKKSDVVTVEIEHISAESLSAVEKHAPLRPSHFVIGTVRDRVVQKTWLNEHDFPIARWMPVEVTRYAYFCEELKSPGILKTAGGGYDGRGQRTVWDDPGITTAFHELKSPRYVLEEKEQLMAEISVMVAHAPDGSYLAHPVAYNYHVDGILDTTMLPYFESYKHEKRATEIAIAIAQKLALEGVLTVEYFITTDDRLLVNELAPRIHNSYHASLHGCRTSHAEQAIRSVCGLPLGDPHSVRPSAMANLLGDLWKNGAPPPFERALAHSEVTLHLYNKGEARPGRKMGHLTATGSTPEEAYQRVARAREALKS